MAAALRCLGRARTILRTGEALGTIPIAPALIRLTTQIRCEHIDFTKLNVNTLDASQLTDFEVSKDPKEWQYVERLLPLAIVPQPKKFDGVTPSGWVPPKEEALNLPYFVVRTKNHMQPVYLSLSYRNQRRITLIKKIQGDIWQMERELREFLESKLERSYKGIASRVNEMSGQIRFRGDHVAYVKQWMDMKGL